MANSSGLRFSKTGREIKVAVGNRLEQLQQRLARRDQKLNEFLDNRPLVRSYLVRAIGGRVRYRNPDEVPTLHSDAEIAGEQMEEIRKVCERIFELEAEIKRLQLVISHLADDEVFALTTAQLVGYGFEP